MRIKQYTFPGDILLYNLGDVHRGDHTCDVSLLNQIVETIRTDPYAYWVSTGDLLNVALRKHKHESIYGSDKLEKEYDSLLDEFRPISAKCLGVVSSNHHARVESEIGMSLDRVFCRELGVPYLGDIGVINVTCSRSSYFVAMHHGTAHGHTRGTKTNDLARLAEVVPSADIYLQGHTHTYDSFIDSVRYVDRKRSRLAYFQAYFVTTGHFLNYEDSYATRLKLKPAPKGAAVLELKGSLNARKKVKMDLCN